MNYTFKVAGEIVFLIIVLSFGYDNFYTINQVSGRYVYEFKNTVAEGPNSGDTLLLRKMVVLKAIHG